VSVRLCACGCGTSLADRPQKVRYIHGHNAGGRDVAERFWLKVDRSGECWEWQGAKTLGYGHFSLNKKAVKAHRVAYELTRGPIPDGLVIDHLCRNRACVKPDHLEPVTHAVNILRGTGQSARNARKTVCKYGHALTPDNVYVHPANGSRNCRQCHRDNESRRKRAA
jgi:hypothetical protein